MESLGLKLVLAHNLSHMLFRITSRACWEKGRKSVSKASPQWISLRHCFPSMLFFMISKFVLNVPLKLCNIAPKRKQYIINFWAPRLVVEYFLLVRFQKVTLYERILLCYCCFVEMIWIGQYFVPTRVFDWHVPTLKFKRLDFPMWIKKKNIKNFIRRCYIFFIR